VPFPSYDDEDAMSGVVEQMLAAAGVDCLSSNQAGNNGLSDDAQLAFATAHERAIVSHNMKDFVRLHGSGRGPAATTLASSSSRRNASLRAWSSRS
jgi:hypothetical protein